MWALLSGRLAALKTALGTPASSTVAAKVDTLHDTRVTSTRAGYLDLLNTNLDAKVSLAGGGKTRRVQLLSGSGNWTHTNIKDNFVLVTMVGGGGAGGRDSDAGDGGAGGGGGEIVWKFPLFVTGGSTAYSVAAAAAGRATNGTGANGANTTFGSLTAFGGAGGTGVASSAVENAGGQGGGSTGFLVRVIGGGHAHNDSNTANQRLLYWPGGGGSEGKTSGLNDATKGGANGIQPGVAASGNNSGSGGSSWGVGGPGVTAGGAGANGVDGSGGGGCNTGTSGAGGAGWIMLEYEEAS